MQRKQLNALKKLFEGRNDDLAHLFGALGDACRLNIFKLLLNKKDLCVGDIAEVCGITSSAVSQHMTVMERSGVVRKIRMGQKMCFEIRKDDKKVRALAKIVS